MLDVSFLGIRGLHISGTFLEVYEHADGRLQPILPVLENLRTSIFLAIVFNRANRIPASDELRFARKFVGLKQGDLARATGYTREYFCKVEKNEEVMHRPERLRFWSAVRGAVLMRWLSQSPASIQHRSRKLHEGLNELLPRQGAGLQIQLPGEN